MSNANFTINQPVGTPVVQVSPGTLAFDDVSVGQTSTMEFTITNTGGGTLTGTIIANDTWLQVQPTSFSGPSSLINVTVDTAMLEAGQYTGTITVNSNDPVTPATTINVTLTATCVLVKPNPICLGKSSGLSSQDGLVTFFGSGIVSGKTTIRVYTLSGELVKTLECSGRIYPTNSAMNRTATNTEITWDGLDEQGQLITPGIYVYIYESPAEKGVGKFTVVK